MCSSLTRLALVDGGGHGELVVLDDHQQRQVPEGGQVQGLAEGAVAGGAVGGEHHAQPFLAADGGPEGGADADGDAGADDAVGSQIPGRHVGDVHGAAEAAAVARGLAGDLGEHAVEAAAPGQAVPVAAVGGDDVVVGAEDGADAGGDRLLAEVGVQVAADAALAVELDAGLLEAGGSCRGSGRARAEGRGRGLACPPR